MANEQNTSNISTNILSKAAMVTDINSSYIDEKMYSYARNAAKNTREGDLGTISNEPSTGKCFSAPYKIIGSVTLPDDQELIFSTDNVSSEIGIGDLNKCTYTKLLNMDCLNFNDKYLIKGESKKDFQKGIIVYFTDKYNPVRRIELNKISSITSCDDILHWKKIIQPCITVNKGQVGNIPNGSYSVVIGYVVDNQVFSDYFSITNRVQLFSETGNNSLEIELTNIDQEFKEFSLVVVGNYVDPVTKGATKVARIIGNYSTKVRKISLTDFINTNYKEIQLSTLVVKKKTWLKAGIIESNSNYLFLADLVSRSEEDYQLKAMSIPAEYVVEQVPLEYYEEDGKDVGYYRDENYDFYIQGIFNTGEETDRFHIGGRRATPRDLELASSADVYEYDKQFNDCVDAGRIPKWKIVNTAGRMIPYNNEFVCDRRVLGHGQMGYFESTEPYPNNVAMFGEDAGKPQRFLKIPDESIVPRYEIIGGKTYINIIGVRFYDIPKFNSPDIIGYKITRSDRKGGNGTVVARGLMTHMRHFDDTRLKQTFLYPSYTVNDLSSDKYLSSTQTVFKNGKENNFHPLTGVYDDKFSFYSPHTLFEPRYSLGTEIKIESEEVATVKGNFEIVHNHPKEKLMNQFAFWLAASVGLIEAVLVLAGKKNDTQRTVASALGVASGTAYEFDKDFRIRSVEDLIGLDIQGYIQAQIQAGAFNSLIGTIKTILTSVASLGIKIPYSIFSGIREADVMFQTIMDFTGYTDYVYQYNAHASFDRSIPVGEGNRRRRLLFPAKYIPPTNVTVNNKQINNLLREKFVFFELNKPIARPFNIDNSLNTISGFKICGNPTATVTSRGSAFYVTNKAINPNQYGQLGSAFPVTVSGCPLDFGDDLTTSPIMYGGDCVIGRFQFMKKMQFFSQNIANTNFPPGTEYDYRKYRGIAFPRFWADFTKFDFSELLSGNIINFTRFSRTTTSKHNLDCKKGNKKSPVRIDDAYMYLSNNAVMDFIVEADYNVAFREETAIRHYSKNDTNLSELFRSDRIDTAEEFKINYNVYSDLYTTEIFAQQQRHDFDPNNPIPTDQPNSVIYSLPSFNLQEADNWQYFLPANYFAFNYTDFGKLTTIHKLDQDRLGFFFSASSPFISMGKDFLELEGSGRKVTIGDGGIFAQDPRETFPTDENYGACTSRYAFSANRFGRFYPSEDKGMIMDFAESPQDISNQGISFWCKNYMPIFLYKYFPDYPRVENPVSGVGYLMTFDSSYKILYITKRDFSPKKEFSKYITYSNGLFYYKTQEISLRDSKFFNDISWTLSYSPEDKSFVSFHDWHPDWVIQTSRHFMSVKDKTVWKHNERYDSFCKFYDKDYPFVIEFVSSSGQTIHIVRSLEYILEVYNYKNFGRDRFHVHHQNFDGLMVWNSEQMSPLINLVYSSSDPEKDLDYPKINTSTPVTFDSLFSKEENKYRVNQFWDAVKDRGEFTSSEYHLFPTDESGYKSIINPLAVDMDKPEEERKKFRHYFNKFRFSKSVSGENNLLIKIANVKKLVSIR